LAAVGESTVTLFVPDTAVADSLRSFEALVATRLAFTVEPAADATVRAEWGGRAFIGLAEVERLAAALTRFREALSGGWGEIGDPEIRRLARLRYDRLMSIAHDRLHAILAQPVR
jgi:hypothetical protein